MRTIIAAVTAVVLAVLSPSSLDAQNRRSVRRRRFRPQRRAPNYDLAAQWTSQKVRQARLRHERDAAMARDQRSVLVRVSDARGAASSRSSIRSRGRRRRSSITPRWRRRSRRSRASPTTRSTCRSRPCASSRRTRPSSSTSQVPADAVIAAPPKRDTTTEQRAPRRSGGEVAARQPTTIRRTRSSDTRTGGAPAAAAARPATAADADAALRVRPRDRAGLRSSTDYKQSRGCRDGRRLARRARPWCSRRKDNLFMMDADNFAKALKKADDPTIVEAQLTTDGVENYSYARTAREIQNQREQEQQQQQQQEQDGEGEQQERRDERHGRSERPHAGDQSIWSRDSNKFALVRRDSRKVEGPVGHQRAGAAAPDARDLSLRHARRGEHSAVGDARLRSHSRNSASPSRTTVHRIRPCRSPPCRSANNIQRDPRRPAAGQWLSDTPDKLYFTRLSRDQHRMDVVVADTATGEVKTLIEERLNTYVESKPLRLANNGTRDHLLVRARRLGSLLSVRRGDRRAEEPHHRRRIRHDGDRGRRRQGARAVTCRRAAARRAKTRTTRTSIASASTARDSSSSTPATRRMPCRSPNRRASSSTTRRASTAPRSRRSTT